MYTIREYLAIGLAAILGVALLLAPKAVLRLQWFMFDPTSGRRGEWGQGDRTREMPEWVHWVIRVIGLAVLGIGAAIAAMPHL